VVGGILREMGVSRAWGDRGGQGGVKALNWGGASKHLAEGAGALYVSGSDRNKWQR
jgi:hypothetical protein